MNAMNISGDSAWMNYSVETDTAAYIFVPSAGEHDFRIYMRTKGIEIDKIVLTPDPAFVPDHITDTLAETIYDTTTYINLSHNHIQNFTCFPNPFISQLTIEYNLPCNCFVNVAVYDITGNKITTLVNEYKLAGKYQKIWHTNSKLSKGVYFIQINSDNSSKTIKSVHIE